MAWVSLACASSRYWQRTIEGDHRVAAHEATLAFLGRRGQARLRRSRHPGGFPLFSRAHVPPGVRRRGDVVMLRLVLAVWTASIYAIYWLGYLRGSS